MDPRISRLAEQLVTFSVQANKGDKLLVEGIGLDTLPLVEEVLRIATQRGVHAFHTLHDHGLLRTVLLNGSEEQVQAMARYPLAQMKEMDCYIGIRGPANSSELADVPKERMSWYTRHFVEPVHMKVRVPDTRWVVLRYPNASMAQLAKRSVRSFEDFYFEVCTLDYGKMSKAMDPLKELMDATDRVEIEARDTKLAFSIKGLSAIKCDGRLNIPDGEVYTAPVKDSVEGTIVFNAGSLFEGSMFGPIKVWFEKGKVTKVDAGSDTAAVEHILDRDEGARYVGEFALGVNPFITSPMMDTLFDEKISGSLHMALGNSYDDCDNGNKSQNHWDLVHIQTPQWGGGEIKFDGKLIRKDGLFVHDLLLGLNPENLK